MFYPYIGWRTYLFLGVKLDFSEHSPTQTWGVFIFLGNWQNFQSAWLLYIFTRKVGSWCCPNACSILPLAFYILSPILPFTIATLVNERFYSIMVTLCSPNGQWWCPACFMFQLVIFIPFLATMHFVHITNWTFFFIRYFLYLHFKCYALSSFPL